MQSEGGYTGTVHGALQGGALATTFTASRGLMLMLPNMYKIAGELTSAVFHVAAARWRRRGCRFLATIQDVMAARSTGFAAARLRLGAGGAGLQPWLPTASPCSAGCLIHFFDGFRTSTG